MFLSLCLCLFLGLSVCVYGWDEFSFIGNPVEDVITFYDLPLVSAYSLDDGISPLAESSTSARLMDLASFDSVNVGAFAIGYVPRVPAQPPYIPAIDAYYTRHYLSLSTVSGYPKKETYRLVSRYSGSNYSFTGTEEFRSNFIPCIGFSEFSSDAPSSYLENGYYSVSFDVSRFGSFKSFELDGRFHGFLNFNSSAITPYLQCWKYELLVNGSLVHTFYEQSNGYAYFNHFIHSGSTSVSSVALRFYPYIYQPTTYYPYLTIEMASYFYDSTFTILVDDEIFLSNVDDAQNSINQYESDSSQWIGSMSSNFAQLSLGSFSFPANLTGASALLTGIFNDVWLAMGDYKIIYVFPLFLGIVLVLIGRIAKYAAAGHSHGYGADKGADG